MVFARLRLYQRVCRWEALVFEGPASSSAGVGAPSTGLAAVQLHGQRYPAVAVAAGNTIKVCVVCDV